VDDRHLLTALNRVQGCQHVSRVPFRSRDAVSWL
jgi:hypothetical protein